MEHSNKRPRVALLWRGERQTAGDPVAANNRLAPIFEALAQEGVAAEPAPYAEECADEVRAQLAGVDGVLVWVDPISGGRDRSGLDPLLREAATAGVWVSAHPDVILKMGVKEVLHRTRDLGWGTDTQLYATVADFRARFPEVLAAGPRVLKQNRGNGGQGVWKVELTAAARAHATPDASSPVEVLHAQRGSQVEPMTLGALMDRCQVYFTGEGRLIDQPFQPRLPEGMIRCYLVQDRVVGFGRQLIKALLPPPAPGEPPEAALPGPRIMSGADYPPFQALRTAMEAEWVPAMLHAAGASSATTCPRSGTPTSSMGRRRRPATTATSSARSMSARCCRSPTRPRPRSPAASPADWPRANPSDPKLKPRSLAPCPTRSSTAASC